MAMRYFKGSMMPFFIRRASTSVGSAIEQVLDKSKSLPNGFVPIFDKHTTALPILKDKAIVSQLRNQFEFFKKPSVLLRQSMNSISEQISDGSKFKTILIDGKEGAGKSCTLLHTVDHCLKENWFVVYVPNLMPYVNGKSQIMKEHGSTNYVHPELGLNLLKQIELLNNHFLNTMKLHKDHRLGETFTTAGRKIVTIHKGMVLSKVIEVAKENPQQSNQIFLSLFQDFTEQKDVPILLALDNVGCLLVKTNFDNPDDPHQFKKQKLEPSSFLLLNKFSKFAFGDEKYGKGAVVSAFSRSTSNTVLQDASATVDHILPTLLKKGISKVEVENFDQDELTKCLDYYRENGFIAKKAFQTPEEVQKVKLLTRSNGKELFYVLKNYA